MVQGLSSQGSVGRCVERIRVIGHVVLLGWVPCVPWCGRLIRTWTRYSEPGQPRPHAEQAARVWDSRLMCGTGRPRAGGGGPTPGSPHRARTRYAEPGPSRPHVDPLFRAWATPPAYGTGGPRAGQVVRVRDARDPESLSHAANPGRIVGQLRTLAMQYVHRRDNCNRRRHRLFCTGEVEKSPFQQYVVSYCSKTPASSMWTRPG